MSRLAKSMAMALGLAFAPPSDNLDPPETVCVTFWPEARYVAGYDHIVWLSNGCDSNASCVVWTDVNPAPQDTTVPAHSTVGVVTFRGSPASTFVPFVRCVVSAPASEF